LTEFEYYLNKFSNNKIYITEFSLKYAKDFFRNNFKVEQIKIGVELEFYLIFNQIQKSNYNKFPNTENSQEIYNIEDFIKLGNSDPFINNIGKIKKEQGLNQLEFSSIAYNDLIKLCQDLDILKKKLEILAKNLNLEISFQAFNNFDDCPSSLQFNISYADYQESNILKDSPILKQLTYTNLLDKTNQILFFLAPTELDYLRYSKEVNKRLFSNAKYNSPVNLSVGLNNRSCAIRIPSVKNDEEDRIEYRVASSYCDHWLALSAILLSLSSRDFKENKYQLIYGNAFDENYDYLSEIIQNIDLSKKNFFNIDNDIYKKFLTACK
jgi:glutamine synthetase